MTPEQIDRVFGCRRLKMTTGEHVEVFREAIVPGERRRYTKRFLDTTDGHFAHWTEREWRILARLTGHGIDCVPDVVQFDRGSIAGTQRVQTYDAGLTPDQRPTSMPLPIGWQREYDYQSPRLLKALEEGRNGDLQLTRQLDWRCDMYSLAAMLKRYLPEEGAVRQSATTGWAAERYDAAKSLILALREHHDRDAPQS